MSQKVTLDDIVFENRNKEYGAYYLRKNYSKYLTKATLIGSAIFVAVLGGALAFNKITAANAEKEIMVDLSATDLQEEQPEEEIEIPEDVPPPPLEEPPPEVAQEKFLPPEPKKDEEVKIEEPPPPAEKLETAVISNKTQEGIEAKDVFIPPPPPKEVAVVKVEEPKEEQVFVMVEQQPEYPGGEKAMYGFLSKNINYPAAATRANISGRVTVQFVVEKDGSIGTVKVLKGIGFGCDEEAVRVIKSMPKWSPGKQNGRAVRVYYTIPVVFQLSE
jgi:protein TonB